MYYSFELNSLPLVTNRYSVTRNTVWEITDSNSILIIINKGSCKITCDFNSFTVKRGDVVFIPSNHSYIREPINGKLCVMTYIHFKINSPIDDIFSTELYEKLSITKNELDNKILCGALPSEYPNRIYLPFVCAGIYDSISVHLNNINVYSSNRPLMCRLQASVSLCNLLLTISQKVINEILSNDKVNDAPVIPHKLGRAITYIANNFSDRISLDELADYCTISKSQLIRYFKQYFNKTPLEYITNYRISRAKELIFNYPGLSLKEISYELGFDNQHYFSRVFHKQTGETPIHYRNRVLNYQTPNKQ